MDTLKLYTSVVHTHEDSYPWFHERIDFRLLNLTSYHLESSFEWINYLERRENPVRQTIMLDPGQMTISNVVPTSWPASLEAIKQCVERIGDRADVWVLNAAVAPDVARRYDGCKNALTPEWDECQRISDDRFKILDDLYPGKIIPLFHMGEDDNRLSEILDQSYYIAFSVPHPGHSLRSREEWLVRTFQRFPGTHRAHAYDLPISLSAPYPFVSADTADVMRDAMSGFVRVTLTNAGLPNSRVPVAFSAKSELRKTSGKHFDTMTSFERSLIVAHLHHYEIPISELKENAIARAKINLCEQNEWSNNKIVVHVSPKLTLF